MGTLFIIKDVRKDPISHYTLRRVEHLRRTLTAALSRSLAAEPGRALLILNPFPIAPGSPVTMAHPALTHYFFPDPKNVGLADLPDPIESLRVLAQQRNGDTIQIERQAIEPEWRTQP